MAYKPSKKKLQTLREEPHLFSILDNGDIATNNLAEESDKVNETQEPLPYVVKTQINTARMISRNPIEWARYLSFERRVHKDNSREDVNFFANGEIKESSRVYEANEEGFERRITKRYDLIDTIRNKEFFSKEIDILTYTNSLEELKEQGLEIQLTHHHETHKKTLENGNEIAKEYDYLKDIYHEVERTKTGELVREIIPSISSAEYFKLYNKLPFESINNENTKLDTNDTIKNTIETNTSIGNNIIQNNDNNNLSLSIASLELEQQNLGEQNGNRHDARIERVRTEVHRDLHTIRTPRETQERTQKEMGERIQEETPSRNLQDKDLTLHNEPRETTSEGILQSSDTRLVSRGTSLREHGEHDLLSSGDDRISTRTTKTSQREETSGHQNGARSEEKGDNPSDERGVSPTPQSPSHQQNSSRDLGLSLSREQPGQTGRLRLFNHGQMGSLFPTDHENQRSKNDNELDRSSNRTNENGDKSPRQNGSANQESARSERYGIAQGSSSQSVLPLAQSRLHHARLSAPNGLGNLEEDKDQERGLLSNLDHLESLLNAIRNNTIASEPDFRSRLSEAIQNNEPLKDSIVGMQLLKDPKTKIFYDKFQLKISPKKVLEILENRIKKSIETANETLNAFNALDSQAIDGNAISNSVGLNPTQESGITDNSVELNNAQEQTAQEQDTQENAQTTIKQETPTAPAIPLNPKIDFKPSEEILIRGKVSRYKANIKAIELLKELQTREKALQKIDEYLRYYATKEEQEVLAQFSGWGGLESYFKKAQHPEEFKELKALLTKDEFRRAYSSTRDAYYTPKLVIDSIYQGLEQLGFNNDNHQKEIFEPSLGTGKFIAHAPSDKNYRFMGTELDPISVNISKFLYPNQVIQNTALENHQFYQEYDAFVGNPPYGSHKIYSSNDKELSNESVHNYFLGKAIKELKDDGIGAFVVSSWFMDSKNPKMREHIAKQATFLGAIRLPNSVFKATGAEVSSDIVFFKKGVDEATNQSFTKAMPYYDKIIDSLDNDTLFALQNNRFDSFTPSDQLKIVNAIASHFGFKQEKLQRWYEKIDTANFGYREQDYKIIKGFIDKVGENNINLNEQTLNEYFTHHPEN
ncbi:Eco57I restriction-modification methylase domain-containing protein, partial [Helicobacter pylori]